MEIKDFVSQNPFEDQMNAAKPLVKKWEKSGLLKNLEGYQKTGMAMLLENQAKQLLKEANTTGTATNAEQWNGVALPLVRRIFGEISTKEFVSVQTMNLPSGLVFFLDFKYTSPSQPGFGSGNMSLFGGSSTASFGRTDVPVDGLYGQGRFAYSINESSSFATVTTASATAATFHYDTRFDAVSGSYFKVTIANASASVLPDMDKNAIRSFVPATSGSVFTVKGYIPALFTYVDSTDTLTFVVSGSGFAANSGSGIKVYYTKQTRPEFRGDFEDTIGTTAAPISSSDYSNGIPQVDLQLRSEAIVAKTRKLKAQWTPEFAQDLNAYHSIDAEAELTSMLSEYISIEIDLEILDMLFQNALTTEYWSTTINEYFDGSNWVTGSVTAVGYTQPTWFATLGTKVQKIRNKIHQLTLRGGANWMVVSPDIATILESIPGYMADNSSDKSKFTMGVQKAGTYNSQVNVFKNPYITSNIILLGFKGSQFLETGAAYCPYVPLMTTPLVYDPDNFTPRRGVMTRYAKKMLRPEFYGRIFVKGLNLI